MDESIFKFLVKGTLVHVYFRMTFIVSHLMSSKIFKLPATASHTILIKILIKIPTIERDRPLRRTPWRARTPSWAPRCTVPPPRPPCKRPRIRCGTPHAPPRRTATLRAASRRLQYQYQYHFQYQPTLVVAAAGQTAALEASSGQTESTQKTKPRALIHDVYCFQKNIWGYAKKGELHRTKGSLGTKVKILL